MAVQCLGVARRPLFWALGGERRAGEGKVREAPEASGPRESPVPSLPESLEPTYQQLQKMKLDKSPFVVVSVVGQELLTANHHGASVVVLEAALKIGTCSLKLRGSVFSALSSAYWSLGNTEKSTGYMQQDLDVAKTLGRGPCLAPWGCPPSTLLLTGRAAQAPPDTPRGCPHACRALRVCRAGGAGWPGSPQEGLPWPPLTAASGCLSPR